MRKLIETGEICEDPFLCIRRRREDECARIVFAPVFQPVTTTLYSGAAAMVLLVMMSLRGSPQHQSGPTLPIGVVGAEGDVVARYFADDFDAQVVSLGHVLHQSVISVGQKQIGAGPGEAVFVFHLIDQLVDRFAAPAIAYILLPGP